MNDKKFDSETLLNYAFNRWGLNRTSSVGKLSELIRKCAPKRIEEWERYYFENAVQNKKQGQKIDKDTLIDIGQRLYTLLTEVVQKQLDDITEDMCIEYVFYVVLNRTFNGYQTEIATIYGQLEQALHITINPAPQEWDTGYAVDFYYESNGVLVGFQIKPEKSFDSQVAYKWKKQNEAAHERFRKQKGGRVFYVFSVKQNGKKTIANPEVIEEIRSYIASQI